mgnify:CR=1 FL=1
MTTPNSTTFPPETEISILALTPLESHVLKTAYQCETVVSFVAYIVELTRTGDIDKLTLLCRSALMYRLDDLIEAGGAK